MFDNPDSEVTNPRSTLTRCDSFMFLFDMNDVLSKVYQNKNNKNKNKNSKLNSKSNSDSNSNE